MNDLEQSARSWIDTRTDDKITITLLGQSDNQLKFSVHTCGCGGEPEEPVSQFSVTCPQETGEKWSVWSESPNIQQKLSSVLEFCDSEREKSLEEVLDKMAALLPKADTEAGIDDEEDDDDDYYFEDDVDDVDTEMPQAAKEDSDSDLEETFFGKGANPTAFQRLAKDMKNMKKEAKNFGIDGGPRGDNLFIWDVKLTGFPEDTALGKDLKAWAQNSNREPVVYLEMQFPGDYPMSPPFVRVTRPRFKFLTGHITIGGSICMQMLTRSGWTPSNDIEGILVQIRSEIMSDKNTRLDSNPDRQYTETEAKDAFHRMVKRYQWN
ncbi:ubiquitin-conjugating enzyme E2 Q1-like [Mya arenaria]|uniref:ubiquitin-conjugating enzyme E2 Q1-like n=1 Tax=Mya arenaria TaxID=6604 RepID=UPI0022E795E5|nr:ubiquitin-conjugating enzyme E2 Q1-like [Mya arenaria]